MASQLNDGIAGDARQDGPRERWSMKHTVFDAEEIGSPHLLDGRVGFSIEVNDLGEALFLGVFARFHPGSVVSDGFHTSRTARCGAMMMLRNEQVDGVEAAFEVRSDGCDVDEEGVGRGRFHAQHRAAAHQQRADVHGAPSAGGDPMLVRTHHLFNRIDENGFGYRRHLQSVSTPLHAASVFLRAEEHDASLRGSEGLHALEQPLAVVQDSRSGGHGNVAVGLQLTRHPRFVTLRGGDVHGFGWREREGEAVPIERFIHPWPLPAKGAIGMRLSSLPVSFFVVLGGFIHAPQVLPQMGSNGVQPSWRWRSVHGRAYGDCQRSLPLPVRNRRKPFTPDRD